MSRKKFGQLLQKYLRGECTPQEKLLLNIGMACWKRKPVSQVRKLIGGVGSRLWNQIQQKMDNNELADQTRVIPIRTVSYRWLGIAASLLLVGIWFYAKQPH